MRAEGPADRVDYLLEEVERFLAGNVIGRKQLRSFAGGTSFVAGLLPMLRPFLGGLWAALRDVTPEAPVHASGRMHAGDPHLVWTPQVRWSLQCNRA